MNINILLIARYTVLIMVLISIVLAPAYLAAANDASKYNRMRARMGSWFFGWSFLGWLFALFVATKK